MRFLNHYLKLVVASRKISRYPVSRLTSILVFLLATSASSSQNQASNPPQPAAVPIQVEPGQQSTEPKEVSPLDQFIQQLENAYSTAVDKQGLRVMYRKATCGRDIAHLRQQLDKSALSPDQKKDLEKKI